MQACCPYLGSLPIKAEVITGKAGKIKTRGITSTLHQGIGTHQMDQEQALIGTCV